MRTLLKTPGFIAGLLDWTVGEILNRTVPGHEDAWAWAQRQGERHRRARWRRDRPRERPGRRRVDHYGR
jgi:hypothetical protein